MRMDLRGCKMPMNSELEGRIPSILARLSASKSGFVRKQRFVRNDKLVLRHLVEQGLVEEFENGLGLSVRLTAEGQTIAATIE